MSGSVCDLFFFEPGTSIDSASGPTNADGDVFTSVLTSGSPKFIIYPISAPIDTAYALRTNTSGDFSGLVPGTYVVNCRTSSVCKKELTVVIPFVETWNTRYRLQHETATDSGLSIRFDIEELSYMGSISFPEATELPEQMDWRNEGGDTVFEPVIASSVIIGLNSTTSGQYDHLNTYDEKKYRGTFYVNGVQVWQGFQIPMNNQEPYCLTTNYDVYINFSDGIQDLAYKEFSDDSGNKPSTRISVMSAIIFCLNKTNLRLRIQDTINIYADGMLHSVADSTLKQLFFDPKVYLQNDGTNEPCLSVLKSLMLNLGARLEQSDGVWCVENQTLKTGSATSTRLYSSNGGSISSGTSDYRIKLAGTGSLAPRITFAECSATKSYQPAYGKIKFTYDFGLETNPNILTSGEFDDSEGQIKGWTVTQTGDEDEVQISVESDKQRGAGFTMFQALFDTSTVAIAEKYVILTSDPIEIIGTPSFKLKLSFDVNALIQWTIQVIPSSTQYAYFDYSLSFVDGDGINYFLAKQPNGDYFITEESIVGYTLLEGEWIRQFIDDSGQWKTTSYDINISNLVDFPVQMQFKVRISRNPEYDLPIVGPGLTALRFIETMGIGGTPTRDMNNRRRVKVITAGGTYIRTYFLEGGEEADDGLNIIKPIDSDIFRWKLKNNMYDQGLKAWVQKFNLRNVVISYLPGGEDPQGQETTEIVINSNVRNSLDPVFRHGDLPTDTNYKNIMHGWFSLEDETPTSLWHYRSGGITYTLMELLKNIYQGQYGTTRAKLAGTVDCVEAFPFLGHTVRETLTGKIYVLISCSIKARQALADIEMIEALLGTPGEDPDVEPPVAIADFSAIDFSDVDFNAI